MQNINAVQQAAQQNAAAPSRQALVDSMTSRLDVINTEAGRILCVADVRGAISTLNALAAEHSAVAIIHSGDFGFYEPSSLASVSDRTLKHLVQYSSLIPPAFRSQLLSPSISPTQMRELLANPPKTAFPNASPSDSPAFGLSEFPKLLSGELKLNVPVYTVWGACEDVAILEKIRLAPPSVQSIPSDPSTLAPAPPSTATRPSFGTLPLTPPSYSISNLTVLDEATTRVLLIGGVRLRLFGLGGAVVPHKLFDNGTGTATIAGGQGTMWTTVLQIGELVDTAQKVYDPSETRILITHASPGREGLVSQLALVLKADLTISAGLHFRYGVSYNEFSVQHDPDAFRGKLEASQKSFKEIWDNVKGQVESVVDDNQRSLLQNALAVVNRIPTSNPPGSGGAAIEETAWKNCWHWNLPDAAYGSLVLDIREGRIGSEMKSQGFNFAYRQNTPRPAAAASPVPANAAPSSNTRPNLPHASVATANATPAAAPVPAAPAAPAAFSQQRSFGPGANGPIGRPTPLGNHPNQRGPSGPRGGGRGGFAVPGGWGHSGATAVAGSVVAPSPGTVKDDAKTGSVQAKQDESKPATPAAAQTPAQPAQQQQQRQPSGRGPRNGGAPQQQQQSTTPAPANNAETPASGKVDKGDASATLASTDDAAATESSSAEGAPSTPGEGGRGRGRGRGGRGGRGRSNGEWRGRGGRGKSGSMSGAEGGAEGKSPASAATPASGGGGGGGEGESA
ncbi:ser/Thr protein phosphatase family protein [Rhodotorula toruloides]|uniref:Ser/Thr protein phosphatase family protein n=1 Tax=Rhodotorula toruloides TaxID=5286 RepID=A0A511KDQ4_RHOTO|nr:ser/Thr protein phosphatase family protein [Rhodotorula toruloides]